MSTRYHQLGPLVDAARRRRTIIADRDAASELLAIATDDERAALEAELATSTGAWTPSRRSCGRCSSPPIRTPGAT